MCAKRKQTSRNFSFGHTWKLLDVWPPHPSLSKGLNPSRTLKRLPSVVDTAKGPHCSVYLKKQKKNLACFLKIIKLFFCQFAVYKTARQHHAIKGNVKVNTCSLDPTVWGSLATSIAFIRYTELCRNLCDSSPVNQ